MYNLVIQGLIVLAISLCLETSSFAKSRKSYPSFQCISREEIDQKTKDCSDNEAYAEAAVLCLNKLKDLVDEKTKEAKSQLSSSVQEHTSDTANSQTQATQGGASNYQISQDVLNELIDAAKQARSQVSNYIKDIYVPDEIAWAEAGLDLDDILLAEPCYAENQEVLVLVEEDIYKIIDDLEASRGKSASLQSNTLNKKDSYNNQSRKNKTATGKGKGSVNLKGKKQEKPESDISGTEETDTP
ncbi:MAG: hypothetical protein M9962_04380 [Oligoflexia bacterium]|nr:hypothetical protein [Oligoflexia bacterium]